MAMISRVACGALAGMVFGAAAPAQEPGNPAAGSVLARQLCTACHIVGAERAGSDAAPPFPALAKDPDTTLTELHGWSGPMHPVLSNLALTPRQIADINAYLDHLRAPDEPLPAAGPPVDRSTRPDALETAPPDRIGDPIEVAPE
jgi:mono/diheme cytochrome c family protein